MKKIIKGFIFFIYRLMRQRERELIREKFGLSSTVTFSDLSIEGNVTIGEHTYFNDFARVDSGPNSKISIGKHCAIGRFVHITSKTHDLKQPTTMDGQHVIPHIEADVVIGNYVWIGDHVSIMPGVAVGDYAVIGAHSLVKKDIKSFEIVGGIPARHIRFNTIHKKFPG